jgi:riboflavin synthase alpha subunit
MFSGRISEVGTVLEAGARLVIEAPKTTTGLSVGGSVGVNGTCLSTVLVNKAAGSFAAEISPETARQASRPRRSSPETAPAYPQRPETGVVKTQVRWVC